MVYSVSTVHFQAVEQASQQVFSSASGIVESVANDIISPMDVEKPKTDCISRVVNRKRQRLRPEEPKDMNFEVCFLMIDFKIIYKKCNKIKLNSSLLIFPRYP